MNSNDMGPGRLAACAVGPDPRSRPGRRPPLPAIVALAPAGMLGGARSVYAIAHWGRLPSAEAVQSVGFTREQTPAGSPRHLGVRELAATAVATAVSVWAQGKLGDAAAIASDGKGFRGIDGEELPGVRLVAASCDGAGLGLAQAGVRATTAAGERAGELPPARRCWPPCRWPGGG